MKLDEIVTKLRAGDRDALDAWCDWFAPHTDRVVSVAAAYLTPAEVEVLETVAADVVRHVGERIVDRRGNFDDVPLPFFVLTTLERRIDNYVNSWRRGHTACA